MFQKLRKLSGAVHASATSKKSGSKKQVRAEIAALIEDEADAFLDALDEVPEDRLPGRKLARKLRVLIDHVNAKLAPFECTYEDLPEGEEIAKLDVEFKKLTLERYTRFISETDSLTPFASYEALSIASASDCGIPYPQLATHFQMAVRTLFTHPQFAVTLADRLNKKLKLLSEKEAEHCHIERANIANFVAAYEVNKKHNPALDSNAYIIEKMAQIEATFFFQEQTANLESGECMATDDLVDYIDYWADRISDMTAEEQMSCVPLIEAVQKCSEANNRIVMSIH